MNFSDKLLTLRREKGYSQEQLADILHVSRQSVSKWEAGASMPELSKLIQLSELFQVSVDYLIKEDMTEKENRNISIKDGKLSETQEQLLKKLEQIEREYKDCFREYEYKSKRYLFGLPLVHIHIRRCRDRGYMAYRLMMGGSLINTGVTGAKARGIIAIGNCAVGVISIGILASGGLSIGIFSLGAVSLGVISLGLLSAGVLTAGGIALGVVAFGLLSIGVSAIGVYSTGCAVVAGKIGTGISVAAKAAVGKEDLKGTYKLFTTAMTTRNEVISFLNQHMPDTPKWILRLLTIWYQH